MAGERLPRSPPHPTNPVSLTRGQRSLSKPTPIPLRVPNPCQSSSFSQPGLGWSQSCWAKPLCPLCPGAEPCAAPCAPLAPQLLQQEQLCTFPHHAAFSRSSPGCLHCRNPDGYFSSSTQSAHAGLSVEGLANLCSHQAALGNFGGFGWLLDAAESFTLKLQAKL